MNIYISGSMAYDRIMDFPGRFSDHILPDKIHILNVCFTVNGLVEKFGGTAGNVAYSLSLLGERPVIMATIGKDYERYFQWLTSQGITTEGIRVIDEEFTAGAYITTDRADNQITGFNPGAMKHQAGHSLDGIAPSDAIVLIAPGNLRDMKEYAAECRRRGIRYICDPGQSLTQWDGDSLKEWIDGSFMLITNDYELEMVMKMTGMDKKGLLNLTGTIITTLGEKGSLISTSEGDIQAPAAVVSEVLDPTGAGDAYRSGLLRGLAMGKDMGTSARMGAVAAAYAVEKYGTQEHSYSGEEFLQWFCSYFSSPKFSLYLWR
ncbi:MAG: carbohydrate kinase family protein, partial [Nitrospirales bacterium]|nr:carbohydrate kinase family protein [Nitrospirales bacterium]